MSRLRSLTWFLALFGAMAPTTGCEIVAAVDRSGIEQPPTGDSTSGESSDEKLGDGGAQGSGAESGAGGSMAPSSASGPTGCKQPSECPQPDGDCQLAACNAGVCEIGNVPEGEETVTGQIDGDCKKVVCDGRGGIATIADPTDPFDDGIECTKDTCSGDVATNPNFSAGSPCSGGGGSVCDPTGACVECMSDSDCNPGEVCDAASTCHPSTCDDGVLDGDESDIDCGGICGPTCSLYSGCISDADCRPPLTCSISTSTCT